MPTETLRTYLDFITETAFLAGRLTLGYFQAGLQPEIKADQSPVTLADRMAEELIRSRIEAAYPTHAILGEEYGASKTGSSHVWYIDPIDGTKSFIRGVPLYAVLIGLEIEGQIQAGAAYFPALDEMIAAACGLGCWWNGRRAQVSQIKRLEQAFFTTTSAFGFEKSGNKAVFDRLSRRCYFQTGWGDAYGYMLVATGRAEIMMDPVMSVWDCGPFPPIFVEAGGYFGDWAGQPGIHSGQALATTPALLPQVLKVIHGE
jgi:histidinol-phosphatase